MPQSTLTRLAGITANGQRPLIVAAPPPPPWTPALLASLRGWWVPDTLGYSPGDVVDTLGSSGGVTNTLTETTPASKPTYSSINSKGALLFDGNLGRMKMSDLAITNAATALSTFMLFKLESIATDANAKTLLFFPGTTSSATRFNIALEGATGSVKNIGVQHRNLDAVATQSVWSTTPGDLNTHVLITTYNRAVSPTHIEVWLDGTRILNHNTPYSAAPWDAVNSVEPTYAYKGLNNQTNMKLGNMGVVRAVLSDADRQKLEGYLAHYGGIAANLPSDHPWKAAAPTI